MDIFCYFFIKTHAEGTHLNNLTEEILITTHHTDFYEEIIKISPIYHQIYTISSLQQSHPCRITSWASVVFYSILLRFIWVSS